MLTLDDGNDYDQVLAALKTMEEWDPADRRPMIVIGRTTKGWWPAAHNGTIPGFGEQVVGYHSHPYEMKMNVPYFVALASTFEERFGVTFEGIHDGPVDDEAERLRQFKTNIDVVMSVLEQDGLGEWLSDRLARIGDQVNDDVTLRVDNRKDPFQDERLRVAAIPVEPQTVSVTRADGTAEEVGIELFKQPGEVQGTRRAISELVKWLNHVTGNRFLTVSADLSGSINVENGSLTGHYDPIANPGGTRLKAAIQEAGNASTAVGLVGQSASLDPNVHSGVWALSGSYGRVHPVHVSARARVEPAEPGQPVPGRRPAHPGRPLRPGDGRRRAHALRHLLAAGVEAVSARTGHHPQLLGLQRRGRPATSPPRRSPRATRWSA